ncbi:MAG: hypothetical protein M1438_13740 [Deltaproteobacteria bacterium]|nr:hypothetical protein [Deltaproteobacteria bacterium]
MSIALARTNECATCSDYINSCLSLASERFSQFSSIAEIAALERSLNRYPRLKLLETPRQILVLEDGAAADRLSRAQAAVLKGEVLFEHAAAGEGTRLMLGPKYFLNLSKDLSIERLAHFLSQESGQMVTPEAVAADLKVPPEKLLPLSLGTRHMLQLAFDLTKLARELGESPTEALGRQHLLIIISSEMLAHLEKEFYQWHFFGFNPRQVYFMVQESFHGLNLRDGKFFYDRRSPKRLHNHGQMVMQQTMDRQIFFLSRERPQERNFCSRAAVGDWLQGFSDKISYNIEDLDYLTGSLDFAGLGLALELGQQGYNMIMEVVANNPKKPQKGGMLAWDPELSRDVMVESFQLGDIANADIQYLNRNFNHYPQPVESWRRIGESGLPLPIAVKDGFLYFQPVQGDINFLVETAFFRRRELRPIRSLKSPASLPLALNRMHAQDRQPGFLEFVRESQQGSL